MKDRSYRKEIGYHFIIKYNRCIHYSEKNSRKVPEKKMELKNGKCVVRKVLTEMWNRILEQCSQMELNIRKVSKEKRRWN